MRTIPGKMNPIRGLADFFKAVDPLLVKKNFQPILNISSCTFGTGYDLEHIGFTPSFNSKSTGSIFQVPSVP